MAWKDFTTSRNNKIVIGGVGGVGIIIVAAAAVFNTWVRPAFQIEQPDGDVLLTLSDHGAIGVKSGSGVSFGSNGDCLKSGGSSGNTMTFGTCGSGGAGGNWSGTGALQNAFDNRYVNTSGDTMTGDLIVKATISGSNLYAATSLRGSGLISCSNAATSKLLWNSTSGQFSCGTDQTGASAVTAGQGLTDTSGSFKVNATLTGTLLNFQTVSGALVKAKNTLASSGTIVAEGAISGASLYVATSIQGSGLVDCDLATQTLAWDTTTGRFSCGTDSDTTYTAGRGLGLSAGIFTLNSTITGSLVNFTTVSGSVLKATNSLNSSGTLVFEGAASGSSLYLGTSLKGAGLVNDCDTAGTSKLLWDTTTGRFSCGTDTDTNTTYTAGRGLGLTSTSFSLNTTITGSLLEFSTVSGALVYGKNTVASSGSLVWEGAGSGASLYLGASLQGAGLVTCSNASTSKLLWTSATGRFSCGTDTDTDTNTTYTAGQGLTLAGTSFSLTAAHSGSIIKASTTLASSGTLTVEGAISGASLYLGTSLQGAGLVTCSNATTSKLLWNSSTGRFSCGADQDTNTTYTAGQGLALNGTAFSTNSTLTGSLARFTTLSGSTVYAKTEVRSSGSLLVEGVPRIQRIIAFSLCDPNTACATGSGGQQTFRIPAMMSGFILSTVTMDATFAGTTNTMNVQLKKMKDNTASTTENFLSTTVSLDSTERSSDTAAAAAVITNSTVNDGDVIFPYITAVHTTPAKGVTLNALFVPQ